MHLGADRDPSHISSSLGAISPLSLPLHLLPLIDFLCPSTGSNGGRAGTAALLLGSPSATRCMARRPLTNWLACISLTRRNSTNHQTARHRQKPTQGSASRRSRPTILSMCELASVHTHRARRPSPHASHPDGADAWHAVHRSYSTYRSPFPPHHRLRAAGSCSIETSDA